MARKYKNPANRNNYSNVIKHYGKITCGSSSIYGIEKVNEKEEVTCRKCRKLMESYGYTFSGYTFRVKLDELVKLKRESENE